MKKVAICTSADDRYWPFLQDMLDSLHEVMRGTTFADELEVVVFDERTTPGDMSDLEKFDNYRLFPIENGEEVISDLYPHFESTNTSSCFSAGIRPYLPTYTDADVIIWVDADVWFQDDHAITHILWALEEPSIDLVITPETGPLTSFVNAHESRKSHRRDMETYFDSPELAVYPVMNAGLFGARRNSRLWWVWNDNIEDALMEVDGKWSFGIEQAALNFTVLANDADTRGMRFSPLPVTHNYNARMPMALYHGELSVNTVPYEKISAVHLIAGAKWSPRVVTKCVGNVSDGTIRTMVTRRAILELRSR